MALVVPSVVRKCRILHPRLTPRMRHTRPVSPAGGRGGQEPARPALNQCPGRTGARARQGPLRAASGLTLTGPRLSRRSFNYQDSSRQ